MPDWPYALGLPYVKRAESRAEGRDRYQGPTDPPQGSAIQFNCMGTEAEEYAPVCEPGEQGAMLAIVQRIG